MIIVVEGKNDYSKIKSVFPTASIMTTNGDAIDDKTLAELTELSKKSRIILCLDPDFAGEKIRKQITRFIPNAEHIYAPRELAISKNKKKIGIEHMTNENIRELFKHIKITKHAQLITNEDLFTLRLIGTNDAKKLRTKVCSKLNIGYANGKQFLKKCHMFGISIDELRRCL